MSASIKNSNSRTTYYSLFTFLILLLLLFLYGQGTLMAGNDAELIWTAPGDDFARGQAYKYDVRYSSVPIGSDTTNWWNHALSADSAPYPSPAGYKDSCMISNLSIENHFYVAVRTTDEAYNWSDISNIAEIPSIFCIDITQDGSVNILDILYLLDFLYKDGPPMPSETIGDVDNSGDINILDVIYLINFCYKSGPSPNCGDI